MKIIKAISLGLLSMIGGVLLVLGELDDSPGLGGIGLILTCISIYFNFKLYKK
jgi:hypothetical protein